MLRRLFMLFALWGLFAVIPAQAAVVITFWSHDQDQDFPHTFFALEGTPDAGSPPIDANYGFTAKTITPAILLGNVGGKVEDAKPAYMMRSDPQFSLVLSDAQLAAVQALAAEWDRDSRYNLNKRNCVHFVAEAARRVGLTVPELPKLMKKPRSFLQAVSDANPGRVTPIELSGKAFLAARTVASAPATAIQAAAAPTEAR
ncbi:MAG: hypothetical protein V4659_02765 [Pseudomonadota bacterium]